MAETRTMKCPNCGGAIVFDPGASQVRCGYCGKVFAPEELLRLSQTAFGAGEVGTATPIEEPTYGYNWLFTIKGVVSGGVLLPG